MIVSTSYLQRITKIYDPNYFQIDYAKAIAKWCVEHLKIHGAAPDQHIQDVFKSRRRELREGQDGLAEEFLRQLSSAHEARDSFNTEYLFNKTREYFHKRALLILTDKVEAFALDGKMGEANKLLRNFKTVATDVSPWINPFDDRFIYNLFDTREQNQIMRMPGRLGDLMGPLERGWLVGWLGPMKRGKTFWLFECGIRAAMQRLNVVIISLEMNAITNAMRIYRRLTAMPDHPGEFLYPVFDCVNNQDGSCDLPERRKFNDLTLFTDDTEVKPTFSPEMEYRPCTFCRKNPDQRFKGKFLADTWYKQTVEEKSLDINAVRKEKKRFLTQYGKRIRLRPYPAYSASIDDLESDLDTLEFTEGFIPDVVIIDYADILIPADKRLIERSALDSIWKGLKGMAEKRNCLVITASQGTRKSIERKDMSQMDTAEDIRKLAHVDAMYALNQTPAEKRQMIMRISTLAHRHKSFLDNQVMVLNQLELGLPYIDSEFIYTKPKFKGEE